MHTQDPRQGTQGFPLLQGEQGTCYEQATAELSMPTAKLILET